MRWADARTMLAVCATCLSAAASSNAQEPTPTQSPVQKLGSAIVRAAEARAALKASRRFDETFRKYSRRWFGPAFDWTWFKAQAIAESGLDTAATSPAGARGIMQLMPSTYQVIQSRRPEFGSIDDPEWNIAAGIMHNRSLWRLWSAEIPEAERFNFMFGSYNAGQGTISRATEVARSRLLDHAVWVNIERVAPEVPRWRYLETLGYVRRIDIYYEALRGVR
jgi:membrane-bound lytic murein transglycosylase F